MSAKKAGNSPNGGGKGSSKNMADELRKTQLGKAAKRSKRTEGGVSHKKILKGNNEGNLGGTLDPTSIIKPPVRPGAHRDWYMSGSKMRRCQHFDGKKQCNNEAVKGFFTCSAHSRLEHAVRSELKTPYGPTWMKRLKRNIKRWFDKDLDFWSTLELEKWAKASDVIDVALDAVPNRAEEIYAVLEEPSNDGLRPAARLARAILREKFMLEPSEEGMIPETEVYLYRMWKNSEFYGVFGYNGEEYKVQEGTTLENPTTPPSDSRTRQELKLAFPSINPEGQIMFLEVKAIDAETELFKLQREVPRDTYGKTTLDAKISNLYHEVERIKAEIACMIIVPPATAAKLSELESELELLIAERKGNRGKVEEARQAAKSLRERQAQLLGVPLDRPERLYYKFSTMKNESSDRRISISGPRKRYDTTNLFTMSIDKLKQVGMAFGIPTITSLKFEIKKEELVEIVLKAQSVRDKRQKNAKSNVRHTGNRGKHASKRTSKRKVGKGAAGSGHNSNLRGRFFGSSSITDWDQIIADNSKVTTLRANQPKKKSHAESATIIATTETAPVVLPPKQSVPKVMIPVV